MAGGSFEALEVWQKYSRLAVDLYGLLRDCREFGLRDQMTRAAVSIASNIAEGAERGSSADFIRFLFIAKGSAAELRTQVYIAAKLGTIFPDNEVNDLIRNLKSISGMLHRLIKSQQK